MNIALTLLYRNWNFKIWMGTTIYAHCNPIRLLSPKDSSRLNRIKSINEAIPLKLIIIRNPLVLPIFSAHWNFLDSKIPSRLEHIQIRFIDASKWNILNIRTVTSNKYILQKYFMLRVICPVNPLRAIFEQKSEQLL